MEESQVCHLALLPVLLLCNPWDNVTAADTRSRLQGSHPLTKADPFSCPVLMRSLLSCSGSCWYQRTACDMAGGRSATRAHQTAQACDCAASHSIYT